MESYNPRQEQSSAIEKLVFHQSYLEQLPSIEKILGDIEEASTNGISEAAILLRDANLVDKIKGLKDKIVLLDKSEVLEFLYRTHYDHSEDPDLSEMESVMREYENKAGSRVTNGETSKIRIFLYAHEIAGRNDFVRARFLQTLIHELLHELAYQETRGAGRQNGFSQDHPQYKVPDLMWLDEAITERLTQGLSGDVVSDSQEWQGVFASLSKEESDQVQSETYRDERLQLSSLVEKITDTCSPYKELPKNTSLVFMENFGKPYFNGDFSTLEKNIKELGYADLIDLDALNPSDRDGLVEE